jgi:hypothetical protein
MGWPDVVAVVVVCATVLVGVLAVCATVRSTYEDDEK